MSIPGYYSVLIPVRPCRSLVSLAPRVDFPRQDADQGMRRYRLLLAGCQVRLLPECPTLIRLTKHCAAQGGKLHAQGLQAKVLGTSHDAILFLPGRIA
jgi:hypothetical protein